MVQRIVVIAFDDESRAQEVLHALQHLHQERTLDLADAVVVTKDHAGQLHVRQIEQVSGVGAQAGGMAIGAWFGFFTGLLLIGPGAGLAMGAAAAAVVGKQLRRLTDTGLDDAWITETAARIQPGSSALFLLAAAAQLQPVLDALQPFRGTILSTDLSDEVRLLVEEALRDEEVRTIVQRDADLTRASADR